MLNTLWANDGLDFLCHTFHLYSQTQDLATSLLFEISLQTTTPKETKWSQIGRQNQ